MAVKAYICIGGPLNGQWAITDDFRDAPHHWEYPPNEPRRYGAGGNGTRVNDGPPGMYHHLRDEYHQFNAGGRSSVTSMVWLHKSLIKPPKKPRER